ncbi:MAG: hypothetical protein KJ905_01210 [Nanoarchaeota archaeon]|nr:hypothetical protein [Nanoarchaeota archaeon]MBU1501378.1 hypothetical protein [Nanoarchaeota archaeon]MBU2458820.1 hypothetical protein [Nanoarchaeota archaeon]
MSDLDPETDLVIPFLQGTLYVSRTIDGEEIHGPNRLEYGEPELDVNSGLSFFPYRITFDSLRKARPNLSRRKFAPVGISTEARRTWTGGLQIKIRGSRAYSEFSRAEFRTISNYL